jgi:DNA-directed RNA polymerase specialized sigma24 family protein
MDQRTSERLQQVEPETELIDCLHNGNEEGIAKLFDHYAPAMLGVIYRITGDREKSENLLPSVFIRMQFEKDSFDPGKTRLFTWMLAIARKIALESLEASRPGEIRQGETSVGNTTALDLVYLKGYSPDRAAQALGLSTTDLKKQLRMELINLGASHG